MYSKLREKTGKRFVQKYLIGGPIEPGQTVGETKQGSDGKMYKWTGLQWIQDTFALPSVQLNLPTGFNQDPFLPSGMYRSQVPGMEGMILGTPNFGTFGTQDTPEDTPEEATLLEQAADATDAWTRLKDESAADFRDRRSEYSRKELRSLKKDLKQAKKDGVEGADDALSDLRSAQFNAGFGGTADGTIGSAIGNFKDGDWKTGLVDTAVAGMRAVDDIAMGDKNFGAASEAIDSAVHGVSSALMKSGNPYAMAAGAALEGANFLTKAGGQTVQGFDVDINSSGYGQMGHMESSSSRDFGAMIRLGGIFGQKSLQRKLQKRNQQALMAMNAANIAEDQKFEQEARMNSIQNVIMNNQIALSGGLETNLLGG